jgi:hypothetical protein
VKHDNDGTLSQGATQSLIRAEVSPSPTSGPATDSGRSHDDRGPHAAPPAREAHGPLDLAPLTGSRACTATSVESTMSSTAADLGSTI